MSLKKLFNHKYFYQNIKKSAPTLAIFCGMIPILNTIIFLLAISSNQYGYVATLENISIFTCFGMYILPFILAACLYDFLFKKKSVDFIGSMPITKKTIFTTNTIGGAFIIFVMLLLTTILMYLVSLFFSNVYLPMAILIDYFILFLIGYLFVYVASSLAFSLCGNMITGLAVTLLLLFFIPFIRNYVSMLSEPNMYTSYIACEEEGCKPISYSCDSNDTVCLSHEAKDQYSFSLERKMVDRTYTYPYHVIANFLGFEASEEGIVFHTKSIFLTMVMTVVYVCFGLYFFSKKKLEVSETSFANFNTHLFVKALTLVPFGIMAYHLISLDSFFSTLLIFCLLLVYYFIYDLITRKKIEKIKKSLIAFALSIAVIFGFCALVDVFNSEKKEYILNENEVTKIILSSDYSNFILEEKEDIAYVLSLLTKKDIHEETSYYYDMTIMLGKEKYKLSLLLSEEDYQQLKQKTEVNDIVLDSSLDHVYAVELYHHYLNKEDRKVFIDEASSAIEASDESVATQCTASTVIIFYEYENHKLQKHYVSSCISKTLEQKVVDYGNQYILEQLEEGNIPDIYLLESEGDMDYFFYYYSSKISEFMLKHILEPVDLEKDIFKLGVNFYMPYESIIYYTNAKDEFYEFISELREQVKDTEEYKTYLEDKSGDIYE